MLVEQLVDLGRGLYEFYKGVSINDETLALDEIDAVGIGEGKTFLDTDHTFKHFRDALWMPQLLDVSEWRDGFEATRERELLQKANRQWKERLAEWKPPEINEDLLADVREVVTRARREIEGGSS